VIRSGRRVSMEIRSTRSPGRTTRTRAIHFVSQGHDIDINSSGLRFGLDFLGMSATATATRMSTRCATSRTRARPTAAALRPTC